MFVMKIIVDQNIWNKLSRGLSIGKTNPNYSNLNLVSTWLYSEQFYLSKNVVDLKGKFLLNSI